MGLLSNIRVKSAERAAEAKRIAEEKKQAEIERLSQMSENELLIEIYMKLSNFEKRISDLESQVDSISDEVNQMYLDYLSK